MISVQVRDYLFEFTSFNDWVGRAQIAFLNMGHTSESTICVDQNGLICTRGKYFAKAKYPVRVYAIDDAPYMPKGALGKREVLK
jgi:hypothetical protein